MSAYVQGTSPKEYVTYVQLYINDIAIKFIGVIACSFDLNKGKVWLSIKSLGKLFQSWIVLEEKKL